MGSQIIHGNYGAAPDHDHLHNPAHIWDSAEHGRRHEDDPTAVLQLETVTTIHFSDVAKRTHVVSPLYPIVIQIIPPFLARIRHIFS